MGCFLQAPEDGDASPGVVFINWSVLFEQSASSRGDNLAGRFADPFLPAKRSVLPRAMSEEIDIWLRLRSFNRYQTPQCFRLSSGKYRGFETRV